MVQRYSASESTLINSQQKTVSNRKDEISSLKDEIASHLRNVSDHLNDGETRYAFHEADTASVKLRQLCDMEDSN
jgi:hypothetical protein